MEQNKQLAWWMGSILFCSIALVGGVMAHDRGIDQAIVDHLFDFHFDPQHALEQDRDRYEAERRKEEARQRHYDEFCKELESWSRDSDNSSSGEGTYSPPDNNGCRE
jgi:hypothetical protein